MPRYFFNIRDGTDFLDREGTELSDAARAQQEAIRLAGALIADRAKWGGLGEDWLMEVTDQTGLILFRLDFHVSASAATLGLQRDRAV